MILNLTQHTATPDQLAAGVYEPDAETKKQIQALLTIDELPTKEELVRRAYELTGIVVNLKAQDVMIGGAPYLMNVLEKMFSRTGRRLLYSFSKREVVEQSQPDGTVKKVAVFKHAGWVEVETRFPI